MITLEEIQEAQSRVNRMIDEFVAQDRAQQTVEYAVPEASLELEPGERYAGIVLDANGKPSHHLILLPGYSNRASWADKKAWAESIGGELPTRREQSLLFANLLGFREDWYWSAETHTENSSYAWYQEFFDGIQGSYHKSEKLRAVAVRRVFV